MIKITIDNKLYPKQLRKIEKPPNKLYLMGNIKLINSPGIAIIGSRKNTTYGEKMAKKFAKELNMYGFTTISGMALGIDSFVHKGSLEIEGPTIAVLPSGLKNIYPKENKKLFEDIINNKGLIITEYDEYENADSKKFLERNRIVSGLSLGILVIEGGYRSGTSVTANLAKEEEKNIFCIPSSLESSKGITPNKLIKEGAFLVTEVEDIINKYPDLKLKKHRHRQTKKNDEYIENEYKEIYNILSQDKEIHINEIAKITNLNISDVSYKLTMLELQDKIVSLPGKNYKRK